MTDMPDNINPDRLRAIIADAVARLDPQDRAQRIAWCIENDALGVRMFPAYDRDDLIEFRWATARWQWCGATTCETQCRTN
jgi:hypothetical protein